VHVGIDYDGDGKISPHGPPDDALALRRAVEILPELKG
jgi:hypothetical protein